MKRAMVSDYHEDSTVTLGGRRYRARTPIRVETTIDVGTPVLTPAPPFLGAAAPTVEALEQLEAGLGRNLDLVRIYHDPKDAKLAKPLLDAKAQWALAGGRRILISFTAPWADVANGRLDAAVAHYAAELDQADPTGQLIDVCFGHEPDTYGGRQSSSDFAAAFTTAALAFHRANPNRRMVLILQAWSWRAGGPAASYYPGDESVDMLGADGYNWAGIRPKDKPTPAAQVFGPFLSTAARMGKPTCIPEVNTGGTDDERAAWLADAIQLFTQAGVESMCLFDAIGHDKDGDHDWRLGPSALAAVAAATI